MANRSGTSGKVVDGGGVVEVGEPLAELLGEQAFGLEGLEEQHPDLGAGRLRRHDGGDPLAGDDVDDGVGVAGGEASLELGAVPAPQLVGAPLGPVRPRLLLRAPVLGPPFSRKPRRARTRSTVEGETHTRPM
jgi:hypothetical protein